MKTIGLLSSLLVVLAFATLSITTPVLAKAPYSTTDVLLTGLSNAGILDVDNRALVYFAESFNWRTLPDSFGNPVPLADVVVKYFDPAKKVTTTLFEVPDSVFSGPFVVDRPGNTWNAFYFISVPRVAYDENGNPYVSEVSYEVRKFDGVQSIARIAAGNFDQVRTGFGIQYDAFIPIAALLIREGAVDENAGFNLIKIP